MVDRMQQYRPAVGLYFEYPRVRFFEQLAAVGHLV